MVMILGKCLNPAWEYSGSTGINCAKCTPLSYGHCFSIQRLDPFFFSYSAASTGDSVTTQRPKSGIFVIAFQTFQTKDMRSGTIEPHLTIWGILLLMHFCHFRHLTIHRTENYDLSPMRKLSCWYLFSRSKCRTFRVLFHHAVAIYKDLSISTSVAPRIQKGMISPEFKQTCSVRTLPDTTHNDCTTTEA